MANNVIPVIGCHVLAIGIFLWRSAVPESYSALPGSVVSWFSWAVSSSKSWLMETCSVDCGFLSGGYSVNQVHSWDFFSSVSQGGLADDLAWLTSCELSLVLPRCVVTPCRPVLFCQYDWGTPVGSLIVLNISSKYTWDWGDTWPVCSDRMICTKHAWSGTGPSIFPSNFCSSTCLA